MPGPLPHANRRRRNKATIPTTTLPASGRKDPPPYKPDGLGVDGLSWWEWAWSTPQAAAWDGGAVVFVERRAAFEDDMAALSSVESLDLLDVLEEEVAAKFKAVIRRLAALCGGRLAISKEMRELDNRLGLNPKALSELRWTIVDDAKKDERSHLAPVVSPERWSKLGA